MLHQNIKKIIRFIRIVLCGGELDEGIDMENLSGNRWNPDELLTPESVAKMHNVAPNTIYRILRKELEEDIDPEDSRLPRCILRW